MKRANIKVTLKRKLFTNPSPAGFAKEYRILIDDIFPGKDDYIDFLNEINYEKAVEMSKRILLRLSYETNFPPPTRLIFNILDTETAISADAPSDYVSRDHFVHLVHLYIFGIYIFFYHAGIQDKVFSEFKRKREKSKYVKNNRIRTKTIHDIIISWRHFVLYHDLGYPAEMYGGLQSNNGQAEERRKYLKPYSVISKSIEKDLTLRCLSRLLVIKQLCCPTETNDFGTMVATYFSEQPVLFEILERRGKRQEVTDSESIIAKWKTFSLLEKALGPKSIKLVLAFFDQAEILAVLVRENSDEPVAIVQRQIGKTKVYFTECYPKGTKLFELDLEKAAFRTQEPELLGYYWLYFASNPSETFKGIIGKLKGEPWKNGIFEQLASSFTRRNPLGFSLITNQNDFDNYCFEVYLQLFNLFDFVGGEDNEGSESFKNYTQIKTTLRSISRDLPLVISNVVRDLLKPVVKDKEVIENMEEKELNEIVLLLFKNIGKDLTRFSNQVSEKIDEEVKTMIHEKIKMHDIWDGMRRLFAPNISSSGISVSFEANNLITFPINQVLYFPKSNDPKSALEPLDLKLKESAQKSFSDFVDYKPAFEKNTKRLFYIDHGVCSGAVYLDCLSLLSKLASKSDIDDSVRILFKLGLGIDFDQDFQELSFFLSDGYIEPAFAMVIHNIYPEGFIPKFRTSLDNRPFAFWALLSDSLQPWDRKRGMNQALGQLPYSSYSDHYDVEIEKGTIVITEHGKDLDIKQRVNQLRSYLDQYLLNASSLIRLRLADW